ncbi:MULTISPECIES: glycosyltransferase [unclassified Sulfitobacter]|uniref:glycosyltransferase family 2 protein n=1 Tax=unclassified Sulfitobacter TaxID=196795 RepID=UPI0023E0E3FC|nr:MULTISPECIES: glycosyltransferase [unclassified Sulfitobacter]
MSLSNTAVVIPCYNAAGSIRDVVAEVPEAIGRIYCVNDASPDTLAKVLDEIAAEDPRVQVLTHEVNSGVGAATVTGYYAAIEGDAKVIVKLDSDGQMDPRLIPALIEPILRGDADYVKGNRFFDIASVQKMPAVRLIGNAGLSFMSKLSSGLWHLFDPTNGFTAIHADVAAILPLDKLHKRYFFESDLLFRLGTVGAAVTDVPMEAVYGDEKSGLNEFDALLKFPGLHARNLATRVFYNYFLRGFSTASLMLLVGSLLFTFGGSYGVSQWMESARTGVPATAGTVMLSAFPVLLGVQMLLNFLSHDVSASQRPALHPHIARVRVLKRWQPPAPDKFQRGAGPVSRMAASTSPLAAALESSNSGRATMATAAASARGMPKNTSTPAAPASATPSPASESASAPATLRPASIIQVSNGLSGSPAAAKPAMIPLEAVSQTSNVSSAAGKRFGPAVLCSGGDVLRTRRRRRSAKATVTSDK